jgi:hypothetical protein
MRLMGEQTYNRWQVIYALHACSFAPQLRLMHLSRWFQLYLLVLLHLTSV